MYHTHTILRDLTSLANLLKSTHYTSLAKLLKSTHYGIRRHAIFGHVRKISEIIHFVMSVRLFVRPHGTTRVPLDGTS